nr:hypothetical protein [Tanacetum cinerariifolium]
TRIGLAIQTALQSYTAEFKKKAQDKKEKYIDIIEKSVKEIIKVKVKSQLPQILPKEIYDIATPVIKSTINESLKNTKTDEDPLVGSDQVLKKKKTSMDAEPLKGSKSNESKSSSSKGSKSQSKSSGKFAQAEELVFEIIDIEMPQDQ